MPEMHLRQPGFTYSACGPFTKNKERIQKFKQTGDSRYIYRNELDEGRFRHDIAYGDFKDLAKRTAVDKVLRDKAFNIAKNSKYDGYQMDKKTAGSGATTLANKSTIKSIPQNEECIQHLKIIFGVLI